MSSSTATFPRLANTVTAGRSGTPPSGSFFQHHGAWAPGVRLFRALNFRAKALIVSSVFMVPVALLSWSFVKDKAAAIEFSAKERGGLAYLRDAVPLVKLGQTYRLQAVLAQAKGGATPELSEARRGLEAQMSKVAAADATAGADLGTAKALAAVRAAALAAASAAPEALFDAHSAHIDAVMALIGQASDGSNLTLDPDLDTYYLMDGSLGALPVLIEATAKLRGAAAAAAASGKPAGEALQRVITSSAVTTELFESRVYNALDKVYGVHPEYRASLKADDVMPQLRAFRELAIAGKSDAATLVGRGTASVESMIALQGSMLERLDELLQLRIEGISRHRNLTLIAVGLALLIGSYLFYSFYLVTKGGLNEVTLHLLAITEGDLTTSPKPWGRDEAAALMLALLDMQASLRHIVSHVRGSSESIVHASTEIASASMDLSARTEQTASNLEESAASMEQISSTV